MRSKRKQRGFWQYAIPAAISAVGSWLGSKETNEANVGLNQENRDFQERMSSTAHQREVTDLRAAGLNPMLSAKLGGASSPAGGVAQVQNALGNAVSSAHQGAQTATAVQQMQSQQAQIELLKAQTAEVKGRTLDSSVSTARQLADLYEVQGRTDDPAVRKLHQFELLRSERARAGLLGHQSEKENALANRAHLEYVADYGPGHADYNEIQAGGGFRADVERRKAEAKAAELGLSEAKAGSRFYESDFGINNPFFKALLDIVRGLSSASGAASKPTIVYRR